MSKRMTKAEMEERIARLEWVLRALTTEVEDQSDKFVIGRDGNIDMTTAYACIRGVANYAAKALQ